MAEERVAVNRRVVARPLGLEPQGRSPRVPAISLSAQRIDLDIYEDGSLDDESSMNEGLEVQAKAVILSKLQSWARGPRAWFRRLKARVLGLRIRGMSGSRSLSAFTVYATGVQADGIGVDGAQDSSDPLSVEVSSQPDPDAVHDKITVNSDRPADWVDRVARAEDVSELQRPEGVQAGVEVPVLQELSDPTVLGSKLKSSSGPHPPPRLSPPGGLVLARPPIPVVDTVESEILSPLLDPAQIRLERMAHLQAQEDSRALSEAAESSPHGEQPQLVQPDHITLERENPEIVITYSSEQAMRDTDTAQETLEEEIRSTISESGQPLRPPSLDVTEHSSASEALENPTLELKRLAVRAYQAY